jgi:hypothetical protein
MTWVIWDKHEQQIKAELIMSFDKLTKVRNCFIHLMKQLTILKIMDTHVTIKHCEG